MCSCRIAYSKTSESGEPNLGTAGTPFATFLRSSALRDIQLFTQVWQHGVDSDVNEALIRKTSVQVCVAARVS